MEATRQPWASELALAALKNIRYGSLAVETPDGRSFQFAGTEPGPRAQIRIHDWQMFSRIFRRGDIGFGEAFMDGQWDSEDLASLIACAIRNEAALQGMVWGTWIGRLVYRLRHLFRANNRRGSRKNIQANYDLGNDFYHLWLDPSMTYSSALFAGDPTRSLEQAQIAKYDRILDRLNLKPGARVLEIGCGWGGFAERAAGSRGLKVTGVTLSKEQLEFARARMQRQGLSDSVTLLLQDYRDIPSDVAPFDAVVSIEMIEAVGEEFWESYFKKIRQVLKPGGRAVIQSILIRNELFESYRRSTDFIQQYVFPGGVLPSRDALSRVLERTGLRLDAEFPFGKDYAETLERWAGTFQAKRTEVLGQGFDEHFLRLWRFYLGYCAGAFFAGRIDVNQMEIIHDT